MSTSVIVGSEKNLVSISSSSTISPMDYFLQALNKKQPIRNNSKKILFLPFWSNGIMAVDIFLMIINSAELGNDLSSDKTNSPGGSKQPLKHPIFHQYL